VKRGGSVAFSGSNTASSTGNFFDLFFRPHFFGVVGAGVVLSLVFANISKFLKKQTQTQSQSQKQKKRKKKEKKYTKQNSKIRKQTQHKTKKRRTQKTHFILKRVYF
jgi:mannitol-specific phosphotransferase system IIBC component